MTQSKSSICFIDDSDHELRRFRQNLGSRFEIGTGHTLDDAVANLRKQGIEEPDLFVLEMYSPEGPLSTEQELTELNAAWNQYRAAQADFMSTLGRLRQTSAGGEALADQIRKRYGSPKYVFLTRKANEVIQRRNLPERVASASLESPLSISTLAWMGTAATSAAIIFR